MGACSRIAGRGAGGDGVKRSVPFEKMSYEELSEFTNSLIDEQAAVRELVRGMPHGRACFKTAPPCGNPRSEECDMFDKFCVTHGTCTCIRGKILAVLEEG